MFLTDNGYQVLTAGDGSEAQQVAAQHAGSIDLLLTDVIMPGINGRALAERLAPRYPVMKVLYMSGYTDDGVVHQAGLPSDVPFLQKPFTSDGLLIKVRQVLDA